MQKNTLKKLNHGKIVKPAFKYIKDKVEKFIFREIFSSYFFFETFEKSQKLPYLVN